MKQAALALCVLGALSACSTYDPYYTANPPNPDPTVMRSAPAPMAGTTAVTPVAPVTSANSGTAVTAAGASAAGATVGYRAGYGVIESMSLVYIPTVRGPSASAGSTAATGVPEVGPYRMTVRMEDGGLQSLVVDNRSFMVGDRVQLGTDGRVSRL